jgi:hypothetical protein
MKVRVATAKDEPLIKQIHSDCKNEIGNFNTYFIWTNYLTGKATYTYYIFDDVGFIRFGYSKKNKINVAYDLGVLAEHRNKGYGKKIFSILPKPLMLKCNTDNVKANNLYKTIGMKHHGVVKTKNKQKTMNVWLHI